MRTTLGDLARLVGGELRGDAAMALTGAATTDVARAGEITLADHPDRARSLVACLASAVIASPEVDCGNKASIVVADVHTAFATAVRHFRPLRFAARLGKSPLACVCDSAKLGGNVDVHPGAAIGEGVVVGPHTTIHSGVRIMPDCVIGAGVTLFPNVVLYENTRVGDRTIIHAGAVIGAYGFGYRQVDGRHQLLSHRNFGHIDAVG